ncbi:SDR family NAD(P)-dependent oxidoreductase [Chitinophaga solisilvae]|uniref:SDR family oxidoreductase n=1 Tax=Chitinophaga solisilvae TaxID=1233460 RepID=A0A3S1CYK3_9BACT|nr:SDR family oxidoreductase [Chitinophaga solisilvae]NSL90662.1 SDR family oxidoreductase [Chitinophaga solisilvae]
MSYALITGAAKGIGKAIAAELAQRNYHLLLIDLDEKTLHDTATQLAAAYHVNVHTLYQDLSHPEALQRVTGWSRPWHQELTVVVNNAGYGLNGAFEELSLEEQFNIIDVNIKAQVGLSYAYIPVLRQFPKAYLLNLASTTAYQTVPYLNIYAATKAFALSFTRGLRHELRHSPVSVSALSPGSTDTDFVNRARMGDSTRKIADRFNMTAESVARIAVDGLFKGKAEIIPGFTNKLNAWLPKFFPKTFVEKIAANIYVPKEKAAVVTLTTG